MTILGSTVLPIVFPPEDHARNAPVRVVQDPPYMFILGASFVRVNKRVISLDKSEGFRPSPEVPWVSFQSRSAGGKRSKEAYGEVRPPPSWVPTDLPPLPSSSLGQAAWEDDGTVQWNFAR